MDGCTVTEVEKTGDDKPPGRPSGAPLVPRPAVTLIALGITAGLLWNIVFDATHADYEGAKVTIFLGTIVFFVLGFDVSKWFRGGGS